MNGAMGSIPGWEINIPYTAQNSQKQTKNISRFLVNLQGYTFITTT